MKFKRLALAGAVLTAISIAAHAAGVFPGFPTLGGNANAPTTFTGIETFAVDTNVASGAGAATILMTTPQLGQGPIVLNSTSATATIPNTTPTYVVNVAGTSATTTLPSSPVHGQIQRVAIGVTQVTAFSVTNNTGQTCLPACPFSVPTLTAGAAYAWMYNAPAAQWIKIQ